MSDGVVVDTNVLSWLFDQRPNSLRDRYRTLINDRRVLVAFQSVMELRYGALHAGWGELRRRRLERSLGELTVIQPDDALVSVCAELRHACEQAGHGLGAKPTTGIGGWRPPPCVAKWPSWPTTGSSSGRPVCSCSPRSTRRRRLPGHRGVPNEPVVRRWQPQGVMATCVATSVTTSTVTKPSVARLQTRSGALGPGGLDNIHGPPPAGRRGGTTKPVDK